MHKLYSRLINCGNGAIVDAAMKCESVFLKHRKALVSISGGADSDIVLDICERVRREQPIDIKYIFFNTGIEYTATKEHLDYLEWWYGVDIIRARAVKSIPVCCKQFGQPFASKQASDYIQRLQRHGFQWEDEPIDVLLKRYEGCKAALRWWTNDFTSNPDKPSRYDIGSRRMLKEFMVENPPWFKISPNCCTYAKKKVALEALRENSDCDLNIVGVRRAEGGARANHDKCFDVGKDGVDIYRPIFWFRNDDKVFYDSYFKIKHSDCYEIWGFKRTGCVGCPYSRNLNSDMEVTRKYEPNIYRAACKIFNDSYEYTKMFEDFKKSRKNACK